MSDVWSTLGLDGPVDDLKIIKRAYAAKLRQTRPDDDPDGFMALRDALDAAKSYVNFGAQANITHRSFTQTNQIVEDIFEPSITATPNEISDSLDDVAEAETEGNMQSPVASLITDVQALLKDPFGRADTSRWNLIFEDKRIEAIDDANDFDQAFRDFLLEYFGYFSGDTGLSNSNRSPSVITRIVGYHIFEKMGWHDVGARPMYVQDQIDWLKTDLKIADVQSGMHSQGAHISSPIDDENGRTALAVKITWRLIRVAAIIYVLYLIFGRN